MRSRDPHESFRVATPLELLFDLVFVVGLGTTSAQFAHFVAEGGVEIYAGIIGFAFCVFLGWSGRGFISLGLRVLLIQMTGFTASPSLLQ